MVEEEATYTSVPVNEKCDDNNPEKRPLEAFGARHLQVLLLFLCLTVGYMVRAQLSVSLVAMTITQEEANRSCLYKSCDVNASVESKWSVYQTYYWDKPTQDMILFAFFVGYTTMMIPMGIIAQKFGGKIPILVALGVNGVVSILTPWIPIFAGWYGLCACRLLQGLTQAALFPSMHTMLGKWVPLSERGRLSTFVYTGSAFGTVLSFQLSGLLASTPALGWPSIFWLYGLLCLSCCGLLAWLGAASPTESSTITTEELVFISGDGTADIRAKKRKTPWRAILSSTAVWALVAAQAGSTAGYLFIMTETPTYMKYVLHVDIKKNGLYSSLPYIAMYFLAHLFAQLADWLMNKKIMSIANIRRAANTIGMAVSGLFLVAFGFVNSTLVAVILLIICVGLHSGVHVGFHINQIDLAPNYAGILMSLSNMVANLTGLLVPVVVSNVVKDDVTSQSKWQILLIIAASFQILTNTIFVIFLKGEVQSWNFYEDEDDGNDAERIALNKNNKLVVQEMETAQKEKNDNSLEKSTDENSH